MTLSDDLATLRLSVRFSNAQPSLSVAWECNAALDRVEAEIARLEHLHESCERLLQGKANELLDAVAEKVAAEAEVARLRDGLRLYGSHAKDCEVMRGPWLGREGLGGECSCGYRALLAGSAEQKPEDDPFKGSGIEPHHRRDFYKPEDGAA